MRFSCICILTFLLLSGCEQSEPTAPVPLPNPPSFSGNWTGVASDISFSITESDYKLSGTCVYLGLSLVVNGEQGYPNVSMRLDRAGFYPADFHGTFTHPDTVVGFLNGSGFTNARVVISRY
jgi:hypothetical protein